MRDFIMPQGASTAATSTCKSRRRRKCIREPSPKDVLERDGRGGRRRTLPVRQCACRGSPARLEGAGDLWAS